MEYSVGAVHFLVENVNFLLGKIHFRAQEVCGGALCRS